MQNKRVTKSKQVAAAQAVAAQAQAPIAVAAQAQAPIAVAVVAVPVAVPVPVPVSVPVPVPVPVAVAVPVPVPVPVSVPVPVAVAVAVAVAAQAVAVAPEKKKRRQKPTATDAPVDAHVLEGTEQEQEQEKEQEQEQPLLNVPKKKRVNKSSPGEPIPIASIVNDVPAVTAAVHKKRGRKPKGGKVIHQLVHASASINDAPNIILHLKCSTSDISHDAFIKPGDVVSFNAMETKGADLNESYDGAVGGNFIIGCASNSRNSRTTPESYNSYNHLNHDGDYDDDDANDDEPGSNDKNLKEIWKKLNHLKLCFHKSDVFQNIGAGTRRSCCFWDTCEFDTPPIYIPKCVTSVGGHNVYGCFCSPECALAYLMNEGVDTSVKFERCQMLNSMYGRVLNYEKSIKPAPNPQYILNKFYGNLSIQEYRKLFKSEQIIYVVNKPLTHILPEMYEDNNDFLLNNKVIPNNTYKPKKKTSAFG